MMTAIKFASMIFSLALCFQAWAQQGDAIETVNPSVEQPASLELPQGEIPSIPSPIVPVLETKPEPQLELSPELQALQAIEPGFIPKDKRALQHLMLQKIAAENDTKIKQTRDLTTSTRELFTQEYRKELRKTLAARTNLFDITREAAIYEATKFYDDALKYHPDHPLYSPDALYHAGLFYFERDERIFSDKLTAYNEAREQGRDNLSYPEEDVSRTIDVYEKLLREYPNYIHADSAYYLLGLALWYEGAFYNAVDQFQILKDKFPQSRFVEEVWFRLAEFFYDGNDYDLAIEAYAHVLSNRSSPLYDKALHKTAWAYYQKDRFKDAIDTFMKVLNLTATDTSEVGDSGMRAEAIRYIVKSFSEQVLQGKSRKKTTAIKTRTERDKADREDAEKLGVKVTKRISDYLQTHNNPAFTRDILLETASQLIDDSKIDGAVLAFERTIELDPDGENNPRIDSQIIDLLEEAERMEEVRIRNQSLIQRYSKKSPWYQAHNGNYQAQSYAREAVRDALLALAVYHHSRGKALKDAGKDFAAHFQKAASLYSVYVREYPERDDTHKAIYYMAEAAFELKRFRLALQAYQLLKDYPLPMPDGVRRDATFNIVFTFRHVLETEAAQQRFREIDFDALSSKQRGQTQEEIPELGRQYLASIDEFLAIAPNDSEVPILLFHAAAIYYAYGHIDEASSRFLYIVNTYPKTTAASVAARLIIDDAVSKENWSLVSDLARRFKEENLGGSKGDFARIEGNAKFKIARAVFDEANELQKNNQLGAAKAKYKEASSMFISLLAEDPKNPYADIMLFNAARAIVFSGTSMEALPLYRRLYTQYPNSDLAKDARGLEADVLEKMLKPDEAAKVYESIIKLDPKSERAGDAMLNIALLYDAADNLPKAIAYYVDFAKRYPQRSEAPDALLSAADAYKKMGRISSEIATREQFIKQYRRDKDKFSRLVRTHSEIADAYGMLAKAATSVAQRNKYNKAESEHHRSAVELYAGATDSPEAAYFAGKAQLSLEKSEQEAFRKLTIKARLGKAQGEELTVMMKKLTELAAKNEAIIKKYAQPVWNAESLRRIGDLYEHLAKTMVRAPCPRDVADVDEFACDEYMVLLEDKAAVLEEKALSAYKQAYEIATTSYDAPSDLVGNILAGLNRLRPGEYQRVGNLIELPQIGSFEPLGRMLSTGEMASSLHPQEIDPDKKTPAKLEPVAPALEPTLTDAPANNGEKTPPVMNEEQPQLNEENIDEFEEDE